MNTQFGFAGTGPESAVAPPQPIPSYALFNSTSVAIATFLGSPIAGTILMAINYQRMGKRNKALAAFVAGLAVTGLVIAFAEAIPPYLTTGVALGLVVATKNVAKDVQGAAIQEHVRAGGKLGSKWWAAGLGIVLLLLIVGAVALVLIRQFGSKVTIGTKDEVYYAGAATKADATALGASLKQAGYFLDKGVTARISKSKDGTTVGFVLQDGAWDRPGIVSGYEEIGREIAPSIGGFPIHLRLLNSAEDTMKQLTVGKTVIGTKDVIYYYGSATQSEAQGLGQSLKSAQFFRDAGFTVFLSKGNDGTTITFAVERGAWNLPDQVAVFESLVRQSAATVGGLPIQLRLVTPMLEVRKAETVN